MSVPNTTTSTPAPAAPAADQTPNTTLPPEATTQGTPSQNTTEQSSAASSDAPPAPAADQTPAAAAAAAAPADQTPAAEEDPGYEIELDENSPLSDEELGAIVQYAEKYNLSKEDAEALVKKQESLYSRAKTEVEAKYSQEIEAKKLALTSHPDFSGEKAQDSWVSVNLAVQAFGTPELVAALSDPAKHGYDVSVALMLKNIGDQLRPESKPAGTGVAVGSKAAQDEEEAKLKRLYPKLFND